jgi:formate-dependent nitrite reductase membrane component NrfD
MIPLPASPRQRRALWTTLLVLCSFWIGLVAGTVLGGLFFVPAGSGLAGPAIALGYGVAAALAGAIVAGIVGRRLPPRVLRRTTAVVGAVAAVAVVAVVYLFVKQQAQRQATTDPAERVERALDPRRAGRLS